MRHFFGAFAEDFAAPLRLRLRFAMVSTSVNVNTSNGQIMGSLAAVRT